MSAPQPRPPKNQNPLSCDLLERLAGHAEAAEIIIGGGVAPSERLELARPIEKLPAAERGLCAAGIAMYFALPHPDEPRSLRSP